MALSTVYRMLARHGWRKPAPDTYHPQGDAERREVWKKTARSHSRSLGDVSDLPPFARNVPDTVLDWAMQAQNWGRMASQI